MNALDIALKDLIRSFRSFFAIGMMFVAPLLITGLMYLAFSGMSSGTPTFSLTHVGIVDLDSPSTNIPDFGQLVLEMFQAESVSAWLDAEVFNDETSAVNAINRQELCAAVIIPTGFSESFFGNSNRSALRLIHDPTLSLCPLLIKNLLTSLLDGVTGVQVAIKTDLAQRASLGLPADLVYQQEFIAGYTQWYSTFRRDQYHSSNTAILVANPEAETQLSQPGSGGMSAILGFVLAGQIVFFSFHTGAFSMMSILREDEEGTLPRLFMTPTNRTVILAGKFLAVVFIVLIQAIVMVLIGKLLFRVDWGKPLSILLAIIGQVVASTGLGVLLISLVKTTRQGGPVLGFGLTVMGMLGGLFTVTIPNMPSLFDSLSLFTPQGWVLKNWKATLAGSPPAELVLPLLILLLLGTAMFALGAFLFQQRYSGRK